MKKLRYLLLIFFVGFGILDANAVTNNWIGTVNNSWNVITNWSQGHVPLSTEDVTINLTAALANPTLTTGNGVCNSLTTNSALALPVTIALGTFKLTVTNNITITTSASFTGTGALSAASMSVAGVTFSDAAPTTMTGASAFASGSSNTITGAFQTLTMAVTGSTFTLGANITVISTNSNALNFVSGTTLFNGTSSTTTVTGGVTTVAGSVTFGSPLSCASFTMTTGTYNSNATVTSSGAITLNSGATLNTAATFSGTTMTASAATANFGASCTLSGALTTNGGTITSTAGTLSTTAINMDLYSNTFTLSGVLNCSGNLSIPASTPNDVGNVLTTNASGNIIGGLQLHSGTALNWNGGTSSGSTVNAASQIYSSTANGNAVLTIGAGNNINFTATLLLSTGGASGYYAYLYNNGNLTFTSAGITTQGLSGVGAPINNNSGGTITLTGSTASISLASDNELENYGTITTSTTSSPTAPIITTNPSYIYNQNGGYITINNGTVAIAQGAILVNYAGSTFTANAGTLSFAVAGNMSNYGTMAFNLGSNLTTAAGASTNLYSYAGQVTFDASSIKILAGVNFYNYGMLTTQNSSIVNIIPGTASGYLQNMVGGTVNSTATTYNMNAGGYIYNYAAYNIYTSSILMSGNPSGILNLYNGSNYGNFLINGSTVQFSGTDAIDNATSCTFTINGGTTITSTTAAVTSTIQNYGTFIAGQTNNSYCNITFKGSSETVINYSGGTFTLGSTSSITLSGGSETVQNQNTTANSFTLMSDQYGSASFGQLAATTDKITGNGTAGTGIFNVQRFMTGSTNANFRTYRLLSCPINNTSITSANTNYIPFGTINSSYTVNGTPYYGAFTAGSGGTGAGFSTTNTNPTIYLYNESLNPTSATKNKNFTFGKYVGVTGISGTTLTTTVSTNGTVTTGSASLPAGNAYLLFFIGSTNGRSTSTPESTLPDDATVTNVGYINQQSVPVYLWFTPTSTSLSYTGVASYNFEGYNMVGNPYASTISLNQLYADNHSVSNNISANFYELTDENPSQQYVLWAVTGGTSSSLASNYVVSGQGFMTIAQAAGEKLTFNEGEKVYNNSLTPTSSPQLDLSVVNPNKHPANVALATGIKNAAIVSSADTLSGLHMTVTGQGNAHDECGIYFSKNCKDTFDGYDGYDLDGVNPSIYLSSFTSDNARVALNKMGDYTKYGKRVKLYVKAAADGIYDLSLADIINIDTTNFSVYLIDTKLNDSLDVVHYKTYAFNLSVADTASFANRFVLALERKPTAPYNLVTFAGQKATGGIQLDWNTVNEGNYTSFGLEKLGSNGKYSLIDSVQSNSSGIYAFNDGKPVTGNNIYRLAQNDIHGNVTFAGPININYNTISVNGMFTVYPNPSKDMINISVNSGITGSQATPVYLASIYDLAGTMMDAKQVSSNNWTQDITGYKAGVYILELKTAGGNIIGKAKFVKTN